MIAFWAALGALAGMASVFLLARSARRLVDTAAFRLFLAGAAARVGAITLLGLIAFWGDPLDGFAYLVGLATARMATMHLIPQSWVG